MQLSSLFGIQAENLESSALENKKNGGQQNKLTSQQDVCELETSTPFIARHIGPNNNEQAQMLAALGFATLEEFVSQVVPARLRLEKSKFNNLSSETESSVLAKLKAIAAKNEIYRSFIGLGYYNTLTPTVIKRNILENPLWYTQYTPYQAEISQGRLEALLNYQTLVIDLCGLPVANASLLDEATAAAEAMAIALANYESENSSKDAGVVKVFHVADGIFPQSLALIQTRARPLGITIKVDTVSEMQFGSGSIGAIFQYPAADGSLPEIKTKIEEAQSFGALSIVATDLLALQLLESPGSLGADIALGNSQRFGVPLGYGGPHAAFFACKDKFKRLLPGRIIGVSKDSHGNPALRLSLQTREQHIRREKATSNICTAQVLLAVMASMYAVYHGPRGLKKIASEVHQKACRLASSLEGAGLKLASSQFFDTLTVMLGIKESQDALEKAKGYRINLARLSENTGIALSIDEATTEQDLADLLEILTSKKVALSLSSDSTIPESLQRQTETLKQQVFNSYHSETEFLRYVNRLQSKDLSLAVSMIPLGSCTMKLNATTELVPVSWEEFSNLHPFVPVEQAKGYAEMFASLEHYLKQVTGFAAVSLQPNSGAQGEYAGLLAIRDYHGSRGEAEKRDICLIPKSAHGTNAASAAMAGYEVAAISCDSSGNVEIEDVRRRCEEYGTRVAALMITYPSTHGVFEEDIKEACDLAHAVGAQVYMDGANLNALVGLVRPIDIGADVCHINLHKTFCIPHGGGGPGMGPIAVAKHLQDFLPSHPLVTVGGKDSGGPVSAAPWGSASILPISWIYMHLMGERGLRRATEVAILNANYVAAILQPHYPVLYRGKQGFVAHECIIDLRDIERSSGVKVEDVAKRLMDYGYHAPTISWPVPGTMMIEPTESETKAELDRFCEAMISIREEIRAIENSSNDRIDNLLKNAPHTAQAVIADEWKHSYSREQAAYPAAWTREFKFWPAVGRVDNAYGDRNFVCSCS